MKGTVRTLATLVAAITVALGSGAAVAAAAEPPVDPVTTTTEPAAPPAPEEATPTPPAPPAPPAPPESQMSDVGAQASSTFKVVLNANPESPQMFGFSESATSTSFTLDDDGNAGNAFSNARSFSVPNLLVRSVTQTVPQGYALTNIVCSGPGLTIPNVATRSVTYLAPPAGQQNATCEFFNVKLVTMKITLSTEPAAASQDFTYTSTGTGMPGPAVLDTDSDPAHGTTFASVNLVPNAGARTVTQDLPPGWDFVKILCSGGVTIDNQLRRITFTAQPGAIVSCSFYNQKRGSITILQDTRPNDGQDFAYSTNVAGAPFFTLDDDSDPGLSGSRVLSNLSTLNSPVYTVTQVPVPGYVLDTIVCSPGVSVNTAARSISIALAAGKNVTCTFGNGKLRPDGLVGATGQGLVGDDIYATTPLASQTKTRNVPAGGKVRYLVGAYNDAGIPDTLKIRGVGGGASGFKIKYFRMNGTEITAAVKNGSFSTGLLDPGGYKAIIVQIRAKSSSAFHAVRNANITITSPRTGVKDVVRARAVRV